MGMSGFSKHFAYVHNRWVIYCAVRISFSGVTPHSVIENGLLVFSFQVVQWGDMIVVYLVLGYVGESPDRISVVYTSS